MRASRLILDRAPWLRVWQQDVELPNGSTIPDYLLCQGRSFAMVVPVTEDGHVVMVEQYKHGLGRWALDLPAGYLEENDPSPLETAGRELLEETGYGGGQWRPLGEFVVDPNRSPDRACFFLAVGVRPVQPQHLDPTEEIHTRLVPLAQAARLAREGQIASLSSASALALGLDALRREGESAVHE